VSNVYDRLARRKKLCELGKPFTYTFYNFITDFFTDDCLFDISKFKDKVLIIDEKEDLLVYIDKNYNRQTLSLMKRILAINNIKEL
jgi:hypothetical protein